MDLETKNIWRDETLRYVKQCIDNYNEKKKWGCVKTKNSYHFAVGAD